MMKTTNHKMWKNIELKMISQKWKEAIQVELNSLIKQEVFEPMIQISEDIKPIG